MQNKVFTGLRLDADSLETIKAVALNKNTTQSEIIRQYIKQGLKNEKEANKKEKTENGDVEKAYSTVRRISEKLGYVGRNQIHKIARVNNIKTDFLESWCMKNDIRLVNFSAGVK